MASDGCRRRDRRAHVSRLSRRPNAPRRGALASARPQRSVRAAVPQSPPRELEHVRQVRFERLHAVFARVHRALRVRPGRAKSSRKRSVLRGIRDVVLGPAVNERVHPELREDLPVSAQMRVKPVEEPEPALHHPEAVGIGQRHVHRPVPAH